MNRCAWVPRSWGYVHKWHIWELDLRMRTHVQSLTMIRVKLIMLSTTTQIMKKINRWIKLYDGSVVVTTLNLSQKSRLNLFSDSMVEPGTISDHYICMGPDRIATSEPIRFRPDRWLTMTRGLYRDMPPTHLQVSHPRGQTITFYGVLS